MCRNRDGSGRKGNRRGSVACTFSYFFNEQRFGYNLSIPLNIPNILDLLSSPVTLGDHLRRRRLELGLHQKAVAKIIGVTTSSIWNWEHGVEPVLQYTPRIIEFLGYLPFSYPEDPIERLVWFRKVHGLTLIELGQLLNRHPDQLREWMKRERRPSARNLQKIELFLADELRKSSFRKGRFLDEHPSQREGFLSGF